MKKLYILALLGALVAPNFAYAQTQSQVGFTNANDTFGDPNFVKVSPSNPLPVTASVSIGGFIANGGYATLTSNASTSSSTTIPVAVSGQAATASVRLTNNGTTEVSCVFSTTTATGLANKTQIPANSSVVRGIGAGPYIAVACINQAGDSASNPVILESGTGLGNDSGGGGGGSGGGLSVAFGGTIGSDGTPGGFKDGSGNFQALLGDTTNGQWVNIKASTGIATQTTLASILTNQSTSALTLTHTCSTAGYGEIGCLGQIDDDIKGSISAGSAIIGKVGIDQTTDGTTNGVRLTTQYPAGAVAETASNTGTTAATTATLATNTGQTTFICSYSVRANATAAATVQNTVTGVITATMTHEMWIAPLASGIGIDEQIFNPCVPASGANQTIAVVSGAPGSGGLVSVTATGYLK